MKALKIPFLLGVIVIFVILFGCEDSVVNKERPVPPTPPTGNLVGYSDCKTSRIETTTDSTPPNQECIEYQYDGDSLLLLKHINTGFNCCPDTIIAGINIKDSLITIQESQSLENGGCKCLCLFDLNFEIRNLEPGEYTIKVISPYIHPDEEQLEFSTTLSSSPSSGRYCVERNHYPWGNTEENPDWINKLIATFASEPVGNPPQSIWQYEYKGQRVYYIPPQCCDQFSTLYNAAGSVICAPDGGYTGEGDGRCTDFFKERKNEKLIWQDSRTN